MQIELSSKKRVYKCPHNGCVAVFLRKSNLEKHQASSRHQCSSRSLHDRIGALLKNVVSSTSYITSKNAVRTDILQPVRIDDAPGPVTQLESTCSEGNHLFTCKTLLYRKLCLNSNCNHIFLFSRLG